MEELLKQIEEFGGILDLSVLNEEGQKFVRNFYNFLSDQCKSRETSTLA